MKMTKQEQGEKLQKKKKVKTTKQEWGKKLPQKANEDDRVIVTRGATASKQNSHEESFLKTKKGEEEDSRGENKYDKMKYVWVANKYWGWRVGMIFFFFSKT